MNMKTKQTSLHSYESPIVDIVEIAIEQAILQCSLPDLDEEEWN